MPKNLVQFQKGQSLAAFMEAYGSESQCEQALFQARWPKGFQCPACGYGKHCRLRQRKVLQCIRCKRQVSLTAGTLLENTKLPLCTWYLAMYLLAQSKHGISAMELMRQLGVSYNTAWMVKHKLMQAMRQRDDSQPLRLRLSVVKGFRLKELERWASRHLRPGTVVRTDGLACFRGVTAAGCRHEPRVTGGGKGSCETPGLTWVNTLLGNVKRALDGTYHSTYDARYAGRYLAEFAYRFNRRYQLADLVPRLAYIAARTPPLPLPLLRLAGTSG